MPRGADPPLRVRTLWDPTASGCVRLLLVSADGGSSRQFTRRRALVLVLGTNVAVLLDGSKSSMQCSLPFLLIRQVIRQAEENPGNSQGTKTNTSHRNSCRSARANAFLLTYLPLAHFYLPLLLAAENIEGRYPAEDSGKVVGGSLDPCLGFRVRLLWGYGVGDH
jgi:hypothetical protein